MNIPYRTRRLLRRIAIIVLVCLLVFAIGLSFWFLWLERFVVYSRQEGASLNMSAGQIPSGQAAVQPDPIDDVPIFYNEGENALQMDTTLQQLSGYYVDVAASKNIPQVMQQIDALPAGTPVLVDVKTSFGDFLYSSKVGQFHASDTSAMDQLIQELTDSGRYVIARFPALRDWQYGVAHVPCGIHHISRQYLWDDQYGYYWLDPTVQGTMDYLVQIINELRELGFDEVVLDDYAIPNASDVYFLSDRQKVLTDTAKSLVSACATDRFAVSFQAELSAFTMPEGRSRLYLTDVDAAQAASIAEQTGLADTKVNLVFLATVHDTRFDEYSVLRPLDAAH